MFKCVECGDIFEEPRTYEEHHPYGMGYATESFACCPSCEGAFKEAQLCKCCDEWFFEYELENGICENCEENQN